MATFPIVSPIAGIAIDTSVVDGGGIWRVGFGRRTSREMKMESRGSNLELLSQVAPNAALRLCPAKELLDSPMEHQPNWGNCNWVSVAGTGGGMRRGMGRSGKAGWDLRIFAQFGINVSESLESRYS